MSSSPSFSNDALRPSLPPTSQGPRQQPEQQIPKPKVILLLHPDKQNHGLLQKLKRHADLVKFTNLETSDAVVSCRNRTLSLLLLTLNEMNNPSLFAKTVIRLSNFQAKSSQHPIAVFISPTRDKTPSNWFALQEQAPLNGRLSFLLASDLDDACRGVCEAISLLGDDAKRQAQNRYYASLLSGATSSEAAEDVGRELFLNCLRLNDEKELWRVLAVYGQMNALAGAGRDQLLKECPIERATAESLTEFLDGLGE